MMSQRNELLKRIDDTKNPALRRALEKDVMAIDKAQADKRSEALTAALSFAQRKMKEGLSGSEDRYFPEGANQRMGGGTFSQTAGAAGVPALPQEAHDQASNVAGMATDLLADPLNAVGAPLAAAGRAGTKLPGAVASISNYIPDWYSGKPLDIAKGFAGWAGDSVKSGVEHILDPRSRAAFSEQKVTNPALQRVKNLLDTTGDTRAIDKGVAQAQYTSHHIPTQAGQDVATAPAAKELMDRSFLSEPVDDLSAELQKHSAKVDDTASTPQGAKAWDDMPDKTITPDEADFVAKYAEQKMGTENKYVLKAPVSPQTGGHHHDVVYSSPAKEALTDGFKNMMDADGNVNLKQLYGWLEQNKGKYNQKLKDSNRPKDSWGVINSSAEHVAKNGLWLRGSKIGTAITEGGVGWMMKIEPDGTMKTFMMDKHDFMEKVPGIREFMGAVIPQDLVAVTPMMPNNIKNLNKKGIKAKVKDADGNIVKDGRKHVTKTHKPAETYQQTQRRGTKEPYRGLLEEYTKIKASTKGTARETAALVGEGLLAQRAQD